MIFENLTLITIFQVFFDKKHSKSPQANICGRDSFKTPQHSFFFCASPPPSKFRNEGCLPEHIYVLDANLEIPNQLPSIH